MFNGILVRGDFAGDVMFYGRGAGAEPTASAIVGDIIEISRTLDRPHHGGTWSVVPAFEAESQPRFAWEGTCIRALA